MKKACWCILFLQISLTLLSQSTLRFRNFNSRDGLSHHEVNCLLSDHLGFLWIGTEFGLNRFDGNTFEKWFQTPGDSTSLADNNIHQLLEDKEGLIWVAFEDAISVYSPKTNLFHSFKVVQTEIGDTIRLKQPTLLCDSYGDIWIGNATGHILLLRKNKTKVSSIPVRLSPPGKMQNEFISSMLEDTHHRIWAATSFGIYEINKNYMSARPNQQWTDNKNQNQWLICTQLFETPLGRILCGSWGNSIFQFDETTQHFVPVSKEIQNETGNTVFNFGATDQHIFIAKFNGMVAGMESKKMIIDQEKNTSDIDHYSLLNISAIHAFCRDNMDNFWVGTNNGLFLLDPNYKSYQIISFSELTKNSTDSPRSLDQNGHDLMVGIGSDLLLLNLENLSFVSKPVPLVTKGFHRIIRSGHHIYQPYTNGINVYDTAYQFLKALTTINPVNEQTNYHFALEDTEGNTWLATSRFGLQKINSTGDIHYYLNNANEDLHSVGDMIGDMIISNSGTFYAGGKNLFYFTKGSNQFKAIRLIPDKASDEIRSLTADGEQIWIGTRSGLFVYNETDHSAHQIQMPNETNQSIQDLDIDEHKNLWMVTSSGLVRYNIVDSTTAIFNEQNGWPDGLSTVRVLDNYKIAAGYSGQIILINSNFIQQTTEAATPVITRVDVDDDTMNLFPDANIHFKLSYKQRIRIAYVSISYSNPKEIKYAWQLDGLDNKWHESGNQNSQSFAALSPGVYTFNVKARNSHNTWSNIIPVKFEIQPPFYQTAWFIFFMLLLCVITVYSVYKSRLQKAIQMERLRTRIATDLHDDLGATLSSISFYSEAVHSKTKNQIPEISPILEKMGETSRKMVSSMNDIVWAINPENDDIEKMWHRMRGFVNELAALKKKNIRLQIGNQQHHGKLTLEQRRNIFLIFKEALNNAYKYGDSQNIMVNISWSGHSFNMQITDDGEGFVHGGEQTGNGIRNMHLRAEEIKGQLSIQSEKGNGTRVSLIVPV